MGCGQSGPAGGGAGAHADGRCRAQSRRGERCRQPPGGGHPQQLADAAEQGAHARRWHLSLPSDELRCPQIAELVPLLPHVGRRARSQLPRRLPRVRRPKRHLGSSGRAPQQGHGVRRPHQRQSFGAGGVAARRRLAPERPQRRLASIREGDRLLAGWLHQRGADPLDARGRPAG